MKRRTAPLVIDFDGDKKLDLVALDQQGCLSLRRGGGAADRIFLDGANRPLRLNAHSSGRSGRAQISMVDWDGDGRLDLLVNSANAVWYRNVGEHEGKVVLKEIGNIADRDVSGHNTCPTVAYFDKDGITELLLGAEDGRIYYLRKADSVAFTAEALEPNPPAKKEPRPVSPASSKMNSSTKKPPSPSATPAPSPRPIAVSSRPGSAAPKRKIPTSASGPATLTGTNGPSPSSRPTASSTKANAIPAETPSSGRHPATARPTFSSKSDPTRRHGGAPLPGGFPEYFYPFPLPYVKS